jgi:DNA-binding response OmpR family regulator
MQVMQPDDAVIEAGSLRIHPADFVATIDGRRLSLTNREFRLLVLLASNPGRVLRRDLIAERAWDGHAPGRTIDIHVARLRRSLPPGSIETVIRVGYRFVLGA